jgi:general secretion pathway protein G
MMNHQPNPFAASNRRRGFTLLEMMLVMLLIGGLTAIVVAINFIGQANQARIDLTIVKMRTINQQLQTYSFRHGAFPTTDQGLTELVTGGHVEQAMLVDEWGRPFAYYAPTTDPAHPFDLISDGPDGIPDTDDDIDIWYVDQQKQNR